MLWGGIAYHDNWQLGPGGRCCWLDDIDGQTLNSRNSVKVSKSERDNDDVQSSLSGKIALIPALTRKLIAAEGKLGGSGKFVFCWGQAGPKAVAR